MKKIKLKNDRELLFFIIVTLYFVITRFYKIMDTAGLNCDEAEMDYSIYTLAKYGVDRYNCPFPIYFQNRLSGHNALYTYLAIPLVKLFGFSPFICRIPQIIGGYVILIFGYLLIKELFSKRVGYIYTFLIIICPFFIMSERFALDSTIALPCMVLGLYFEEMFRKTRKRRWLFLSGVSYGIMLYGYIISSIFLFIHFFRLFITEKDRKSTLEMAVIAGIVGLPVIYYMGVLFDIVPEIRTSWLTISKVASSRMGDVQFCPGNCIDLFKKVFLCDNSFNFDSMPGHGALYYISILFFIIGLIVAVRSKYFKILSILAEIFIMYLFISDLTTYKVLLFFFPVLIIVSCGIDAAISYNSIIGRAALVCYLVCFFSFFGKYLDTRCYTYFDRSLYEISKTISVDEDGYVDTSGTYLGDGYVMLGTLCNPKDIEYNGLGIATRIKNLAIDGDYEAGKEVYYLRNHLDYSYEDNNSAGFIQRLAFELQNAGYSLKEASQYYVYRSPR